MKNTKLEKKIGTEKFLHTGNSVHTILDFWQWGYSNGPSGRSLWPVCINDIITFQR